MNLRPLSLLPLETLAVSLNLESKIAYENDPANRLETADDADER